jgi:hypothetical protein
LLRETAQNEQEATRLKQLVFERINSGGEVIEPQESRNALYNGPLNQLCIELARTISFCRMWNIPTESDLQRAQQEPILSDSMLGEDFDFAPENILESNPIYKTMQDVELVLRFFAYRQLSDVEQGRLSDFLDYYLKQGNSFSTSTLGSLKELFLSTSNLIYDTLGERAFYLYRKRRNGSWNWFERPTKVVYDPLMYAFSQFIDRKEIFKQKSKEIEKSLEGFYQKNAAVFEGRSTNQQDIVDRKKLFMDFLGAFVG